MGRPPTAQDGKAAVIKGISLLPGLASSERRFTTRATAEELWASLDVASSPSGRDALHKTRFPKVDAPGLRRFSAYLAQARSFYFASVGMDVLSRPLVVYYALLNLAKAWLTLCDPSITAGKSKLYHGANDEIDVSKQRYYFSQERLAFQPSGVCAEIAKRTATGFFYASTKAVALADLAAYLAETHEEYEGAIDEVPKLIPLHELEICRSTYAGAAGGDLWLRARVSRDVLTARNISPAALPDRAYHFGEVFRHVWIEGEESSHVYESDPIA